MLSVLWGGNDYGTVSKSYSAGSVSGDNYVGGLVGYNYDSVSQSYWDVETSGRNSSAGGTGKTTAEMKQQATYVSWDFTTVWGIVENSSYPYLLWQGGLLVNVPDVVDMSQSSAESAITGAGLTVGTVTTQCSNIVSAGNVISQSPTAGQQVNPGITVNLVVSTGPCPEGEGIVEGEGSPEGVVEGTPEGEGVVEG
ncbi:MAG: PASTA domain-containing protein, partial [Candidatus Hydrogenedens sp.]